MPAILVLEDGTSFIGQGFGAQGRSFGEAVFNTGMTGYQEVLTDPSYAGQIVTMTYPLIGNYGINEEDAQSEQPQVRGFVVREAASFPSNWRSQESLEQYLRRHGIIGLMGVDTRALTRRLRQHGTMRGIISTRPEDVAAPAGLAEEARNTAFAGPALVPSVSTRRAYEIPGSGYRVVVLDFGIKRSILKSLASLGCHLMVLPWNTTADAVMALRPDGVFLSNGPGDPKDVPQAAATLRQLLGRYPIFGICLGHQILGLALGADTYKLKFGHRGANHPVKELASSRVYITSQNHGYAIAPESLPPELRITHLNLNDGTVEGLEHTDLPVYSVQYHPEAAPGPWDSTYLFQRFLDYMARGRKAYA
ncbi:MAG: carbamoyl-phosphate synthase small subunit [Clostridia bacterium]|nr:MAG: carbamoyl-phosphate synthase small subunit [Clostridia bacterium]